MINLVKSLPMTIHHFNEYLVLKIGCDTAEKEPGKEVESQISQITDSRSQAERLVGSRYLWKYSMFWCLGDWWVFDS